MQNLDDSNCPWPQELQQDLVATICQSISHGHLNITDNHQERHKKILNGLPELFKTINKEDTSLEYYEFKKAEFEWYINDVCIKPMVNDTQKAKIRIQHNLLLDHIANSLNEQFPFISMTTIEKAKRDATVNFEQKLKSSIYPFFTNPISSQGLIDLTNEWDKAYVLRSTIWKKLNAHYSNSKSKPKISTLLIERCLNPFLNSIYRQGATPPDYVIHASNKLKKACMETQKQKNKHIQKEKDILRKHPLSQDCQQWTFIIGALTTLTPNNNNQQ